MRIEVQRMLVSGISGIAKTGPKRAFLALTLGTLLMTVFAGCPGTLDNKDQFLAGGANCPSDVPAFLAQKCGTANCHSSAAPAAMLDLQSPGVEARVTDKTGAQCIGKLANTSDPENSLLYTKLLDPPGCGLRMPIGAPLSAEEAICIAQWIETLTPAMGTGGAGGMSGTGGMGGMGGAGGN